MNRARRTTRPSRRTPGSGLRLALGLLALGLVLAGCGQRRSFSPSGQAGELPDQESEDFVFTGTREGVVEWKLYARRAEIYEVRNTTIARSLRVDFFDDEGRMTSQLTAREGELNTLTRDMVARGNVVLQNTSGERMSTQSMRFLHSDQKIVSDELVRVERGGDVLTGVGFESDPALKNYQFRTQVSGTVRSRTETLLGPERGRR